MVAGERWREKDGGGVGMIGGEGTGGGIEWWWNGRWRNGGGPGLVVWERVAKE